MRRSKQAIFRGRIMVLCAIIASVLFVVLSVGNGNALYSGGGGVNGLSSLAPSGVLTRFYDYNYNVGYVNSISPCYASPGQNPLAESWVSPSGDPTVDVSLLKPLSATSGEVENFTTWNAIFFCRVNNNNPNEEVIFPADPLSDKITDSVPPDAYLYNNVLLEYTSYINKNPSLSMTTVPRNLPTKLSLPTINNLSAGTTANTQSLGLNEPHRYFFSSHNFSITMPNIPPSDSGLTDLYVTMSIPTVNVNNWYGNYYCTDGGAGPYRTLSIAEGICPSITRIVKFHFAFSPSGCTSNCNSSPCTLKPSYPESVTLPDAPMPPGTISSVPGPAGSPGNIVTVATPQNSFNATSAYDQYSPPTYLSGLPTGYESNPISLDYYNYASQYPYDDHQTTVIYTQKYSAQKYESTGPPYCSNGASPPLCAKTVTTPTTYGTYVCTSWIGFGVNAVCSGGYCSSGDPPPSCPIPGTSTTTYGTLEYPYTPLGGTYTLYSNGSTTSTPNFPELCPRNFEVLPQPQTDVTGVSIFSNNGNTPDMPNQATVQTQTSVEFTLPASWSQQVRNPLSVNGISYAGNYYIDKSGGGQVLISPPSQDNQTFNISGLMYPSTVAYPYNKSFTISMPPLAVGDQICAQFAITPESGETNYQGTITKVDSNGPVNSSPIPTNSTCSNPVANYPYSRAYGNDIIAGINFSDASGNQCNSSASIIASITPDNSSKPRGSGVQFAALALGQIQEYASAFLRGITPTAPNGLTLANTSGGYGGYYDNSCPSIYNYYLSANQNDPT